ncbi:MAG: amidase [Pseudomonadales bacterium]|nr:amidase [Pseudomonadales bacterium]
MSYLDLSLIDAAAALAAGEVSSLELTRAALARAHAVQSALNCFIAIDDEGALAAARAADAAHAAGKLLGPLHGVPLAHKDMYYRTGEVTSCGSEVRRAYRPTTTATLLERLQGAGAVTIGRLNMTEFALGPTGHNAVWGDCRNPWNTAHVPCGSSSGSGAAVAARTVFASLGSDTGGSTRLPASANGVVGIKPTHSLLSRHGVMGLSFSVDTPGPIARTAADLARVLKVVAGHDTRDPTSSSRAVPDYEAVLNRSIAGLRIGIPTNYFSEAVDPVIAAAIEDAIAVLELHGARRVSVRVSLAEHMSELSRALVYSEATALHGHALRTEADRYSPQVRVRASTGLAIPASTYVEALQLRSVLLRQFVADVFADCDVLITPTLAIPVPTLAETGVGAGEAMWPIIARLVQCTAPFNYLGVPALSLPVGFDHQGLPIGMQLVGRPFAEARLLRVAARYQEATDWHLRAPTVTV